MAQRPVLRGEVGARALRLRSVPREGTCASAGVQGAWVSSEKRETPPRGSQPLKRGGEDRVSVPPGVTPGVGVTKAGRTDPLELWIGACGAPRDKKRGPGINGNKF